MTLTDILATAKEFLESPANMVSAAQALAPELSCMRIYDAPICGVAAADDEYISSLKLIPEAGVPMEPPEFWLAGAKSVISFFLPFTARVKESNRMKGYPSLEWLHGRIEGQGCINALMEHIKVFLIEAKYDAVVPSCDSRFYAGSVLPGGNGVKSYTSNWSERHAAYACGLGTFSLSKGLITECGVAGRFGSVITTFKIPASNRPYSGLYDYCAMCGACAAQCPAGAISVETGKNHDICSEFVNRIANEFDPYYGCGKCQAGVPCESSIPNGNELRE